MPHEPTSIQTLVKQLITTTPHHRRWLESMVLHACKDALPFIAEKIQGCRIKKGVVYIRLDMALLCHELSLNKTLILARLKNAVKALGGDETILRDIIFL